MAGRKTRRCQVPLLVSSWRHKHIGREKLWREVKNAETCTRRGECARGRWKLEAAQRSRAFLNLAFQVHKAPTLGNQVDKRMKVHCLFKTKEKLDINSRL